MEEIRELQRQATSWNELIFVFFFQILYVSLDLSFRELWERKGSRNASSCTIESRRQRGEGLHVTIWDTFTSGAGFFAGYARQNRCAKLGQILCVSGHHGTVIGTRGVKGSVIITIIPSYTFHYEFFFFCGINRRFFVFKIWQMFNTRVIKMKGFHIFYFGNEKMFF